MQLPAARHKNHLFGARKMSQSIYHSNKSFYIFVHETEEMPEENTIEVCLQWLCDLFMLNIDAN